jgi:cyclic beta-1,2-glucan synthetase
VSSYFAHHAGKSLLAQANVLDDQLVLSWFHRDSRIQATELLLQERVPRQVTAGDPRPLDNVRVVPSLPPAPVRRVRAPHTAYPHAQFLSNGECISAITHAGGGYLAFRGTNVSRARPDPTQDHGSQYIYLRDVRENTCWSATYQPTAVVPDEFDVTLGPDSVRFYRRDGDLTTRLDVAVSSEDDVEVRMLTITNTGTRTRELEVTSYVELALSATAADLAHPAFGKLFVQTEALPDIQALLAHRRPRNHGDPSFWAFHVLGRSRALGGGIEWDTDRAAFIGRGRDLRSPAALDGRSLSSTDGLVLDPIFSLRQRLRVRAGASVRLSLSTGVAPNRETAQGLAHKYHELGNARLAFMQAASNEHGRLRHLDIASDDALLFDRLASRVLYEDRSLRADPSVLAANTLGQPGLWRFAISGDLPVLLVLVRESDDAALVKEALQAQEYWRLKGLLADLVVINEHPPGYVDEVHAELTALLDQGPWRTVRHKPGGAYLLRADEMSAQERTLMAATARAVLDGADGDLRSHLDRPYARRLVPPPIVVAEPLAADDSLLPVLSAPPLRFAHDCGGFTEDGREFVITLDGRRQTPVPWVNVISNPAFGTITTEAGSAHTWCLNSRENRLTPFANDPVTDPSAEAWFIRDNDTGELWAPTPGPVARHDGDHVIVRHSAGRTRYSRVHREIVHELDVAVHEREPIKILTLTLTNRSLRTRRLTQCTYCEWILGPPVAHGSDAVVTSRDEESGAIFAVRHAGGDFAGRVSFSWLSARVTAVTGDRRSFLGRHGSVANPTALRAGALDGHLGAGLDPCAALQAEIVIEPGATQVFTWLLGQAASAEEARRLIDALRETDAARGAIDHATGFWDALCGRLQVVTPDDSFDVLINRWLVYQTVSCRLWARSGYHQPGGAFGFRDQLQDVLSLLLVSPDLARDHIVRAARHQFVEGDVQHWWHEPSGRGLRTQCSDDMLWLPFAVLDYLDATGDAPLLDLEVPFIEGEPLAPGQEDAFGEARVSAQQGTIYEHCVRAITRGLTAGPHGLPLMGTCDWNDGMNRVGAGGRGESTWLGFFLHTVLTRFASVARDRGETPRADGYLWEANRLSQTLEMAWDGEWFRRGYYDDGSPLGSAQNDECKIDAISQSWAVISGAVPSRYAERAMDSVRDRLVQRQAGVILLLDPPFDRSTQEPGYIKAYPPGVRENGGQYTHAATWTILALADLGYGDEAVELFHMINPINHTRTLADVNRYKLEPYVMAGDVYSRAPHAGRGGWSWYTGSSGWMYRVGVEHILGLRKRGDRLTIQPSVPRSWTEFTVLWKTGTTTYRIVVTNPDRQNRGVRSVTIDGTISADQWIPVVDDGREHRVEVVMGDGVEEPIAAGSGHLVRGAGSYGRG